MGVKPNGLAFDAVRGILIAANVGDASIPGSHTVSVVDIARRERIAEVKVPGRTRWTIYDEARETFFVNIASPARIIAIDAREPTKISKSFEIPAEGPHGLDFDPATGRLLCACDAGILVAVDAGSGRVLGDVPLSGTPDVIFLHQQSRRLYVAVGDPGVIDVIDIGRMRRLEMVPTEAGAHTLALDQRRAQSLCVPAPIASRCSICRCSMRCVALRPVAMDTDRFDWLIDAPIACPKRGYGAIARIAVLKARNGSMNRRMSQGHAMRTTLGRARVTQTVRPLLSRCGRRSVRSNGCRSPRHASYPPSSVCASNP